MDVEVMAVAYHVDPRESLGDHATTREMILLVPFPAFEAFYKVRGQHRCATEKFVKSHLNMSIVSSENFACSTAEPTMRISCSESVMCGERSHGGVVSGLNLEPEPLID